MTTLLRDVLRQLRDRMPPARLSGRQGRRQRYRGRVIAVVIAVLCGAAVLVPGLHVETEPAEGSAMVPANVKLPYLWQATVGMDPPGTASLLFGGDADALQSDLFEVEGGKLAVVGRNGEYRVQRYPTGKLRAGQDVRLSPDGNLVAQSWLTDGPEDWLIVTDLRTGKSRGVRWDAWGLLFRDRCLAP